MKKYFNNTGQFHRLDGPAYIGLDGYQSWYVNGLRHREDGPAIICSNGNQAWYINGLRHRVDGAAVIFADGPQKWRRQAWWVNGKDITNEVNSWMKEHNIPDYTLWTELHRVQFRLIF